MRVRTGRRPGGLAALAILAAVAVQAAGAPPSRAGEVDRGEYVARAADCVACHSVPGGPAFGGGLKMGSPLGAIYATNISPDLQGGIGRYTLEDFTRALRDGVARDGHHIYPAMPYPSYAKLSDDDIQALYGYFMHQVPPSQQATPANEIPWVLSFRWPLALWNVAFGGGAPYASKPGHDAVWNRGAYLVQGPGHCGACHTPRGVAIQEKALDETSESFLAGAVLDGWSAPNLRGNKRTGLGSWTEDDVATFLRTGHNRFGSAFGSMVDVLNNSTPFLDDPDLHAMAVYLKSLPPTADEPDYVYDPATTQAVRQSVSARSPGAVVYAARCASCHGSDGRGLGASMPPVAGNPTVMDPHPESLINLTLNGSAPLAVKGAPDPYRMPQFRAELSDEQVAAVLTFIRGGWGNGAAAVTPGAVAELRRSTDPTSDKVVLLRMR